MSFGDAYIHTYIKKRFWKHKSFSATQLLTTCYFGLNDDDDGEIESTVAKISSFIVIHSIPFVRRVEGRRAETSAVQCCVHSSTTQCDRK